VNGDMLNDNAQHLKKGGNWLQFSHKILTSMDCMGLKAPNSRVVGAFYL